MKVLHSPEKRGHKGPKVHKESSSAAEDDGNSAAEPRSPGGNLASTERAGAAANAPEPSKSIAGEARGVSRLFLVAQKEGLVWCNYPRASEGEGSDEQAQQLCFHATALWMGEPEQCRGEAEVQKGLSASVLGEPSEARPEVRARGARGKGSCPVIGKLFPRGCFRGGRGWLVLHSSFLPFLGSQSCCLLCKKWNSCEGVMSGLCLFTVTAKTAFPR